MKNHILTVTLNPAVDKIVLVKKFIHGEDFSGERIGLSAGGKGINVSRALKILGGEAVATGLIAGSAGDYIKGELKKENIRNDFLEINGETRINLTIIDKTTGKITRVIKRGPRVDETDLARFRKKFIALLKNCSYAVFSGANANGLTDSVYRELIEIAKNKNVKTVLDTRGKALLSALKAKPFLIKPNREEAGYILRRKLNSLLKVKEAVRYLLGYGIKIVIISMGDRGAVAGEGNEILFASLPRLKGKNSVGCGDALVGGFLFSHSRRESFRDCIKTAVAAGAASVLTSKPGYFKKEDFKKIYGRVNITKE